VVVKLLQPHPLPLLPPDGRRGAKLRHVAVPNSGTGTKFLGWYRFQCFLVRAQLIWYGASQFGTGAVDLVLYQIFWYLTK
jgi:hypothetical protein